MTTIYFAFGALGELAGAHLLDLAAGQQNVAAAGRHALFRTRGRSRLPPLGGRPPSPFIFGHPRGQRLSPDLTAS